MPSVSPNVTLRDVAEAVGVSRATVSRAMNDNPMIRAELRKKIQIKAEEMGYRPDPEARRLMSYLRETRTKRIEAALGLLNAHNPPSAWRKDPYTRDLVRGAKKRCEELGYSLDILSLYEDGMKPRRLDHIIRSRGIRGLLVPPEPEPLFEADLDWSSVVAVATTTTAQTLRMHRVLPHNFHNARLVLEAAIATGAQRIGLIYWPKLEERMMNANAAVYALEGHIHRRFKPLPVYEWHWREEREQDALLGKWIKKHRPDCIIGMGDISFQSLLRLGVSMPREMGYLSYVAASEGIACINENAYAVGTSAIDMLSAHVLRGEAGPPTSAKAMFIEGHLMPGKSLKKFR